MKCLICDQPDDHETEECPYGDGLEDGIAWGREETEACERGTPGCSVRHTRDSECQTW